MTKLEAAAGNEPVLGSWGLAATGYTTGAPAYLSFDIGSGYSRDDLEVWHYSGTSWSPYAANDLTCNRDYANFTVTGFGDYAVTDPSEDADDERRRPRLAATVVGDVADAK